MYANDLAYSKTATEDAYNAAVNEKNSLMIAWQMVEEGGILKPLFPVCVTTRDFVFKNHIPMEIGNGCVSRLLCV